MRNNLICACMHLYASSLSDCHWYKNGQKFPKTTSKGNRKHHSKSITIIIKNMMQACMLSKKYPVTNIQHFALMLRGSKTLVRSPSQSGMIINHKASVINYWFVNLKYAWALNKVPVGNASFGFESNTARQSDQKAMISPFLWNTTQRRLVIITRPEKVINAPSGPHTFSHYEQNGFLGPHLFWGGLKSNVAIRLIRFKMRHSGILYRHPA